MFSLRFVTLLAVVVAAVAPTSAVAAASGSVDPALLATVDALTAAMNRGDDRAIAALLAADAVIVDEIVPYRWVGPGAEAAWARDDGAWIRKRGVSASHSSHGVPTFAHRDATHAYLVVPLAYDYTLAGRRQHETGAWTIVMRKALGRWRIALLGFTKTGDTSDATWNASSSFPK